MCIVLPNLAAIGRTVAQIQRFNGFWKKRIWRSAAILFFLLQKFKFLMTCKVKRVKRRFCAKFLVDRSNHCWDMISIFFKIATVCHLGFLKIEILIADTVWGIKVRHGAKFHIHPSNHCWDMTIISFYFFLNGGHPQSAIFDKLYAYLDHPRRVFASLSLCKIWLETVPLYLSYPFLNLI